MGCLLLARSSEEKSTRDAGVHWPRGAEPGYGACARAGQS